MKADRSFAIPAIAKLPKNTAFTSATNMKIDIAHTSSCKPARA